MDSELKLLEINTIRELLLRYARGIDRRQWDVMTSVFTDDVDAVFQGQVLHGKQAIIDYVTGAAADFEILSSVHALNNMHIDILSASMATADSSGIGYMAFRSGPGPAQLRMRHLRYIDDLARSDNGEWLIRKRVLSNDWEALLPVNDMRPPTG